MESHDRRQRMRGGRVSSDKAESSLESIDRTRPEGKGFRHEEAIESDPGNQAQRLDIERVRPRAAEATR